MKKSVVIVIGVIYALSIVFVTLFGLRHQTFSEIIYVSQVEIIEENASFMNDGTKYIMLTPDENGERKYQLKWTVGPENADDTSVSIIYDEQKKHVTVDDNGLVTFSSIGAIDITIRANDGTYVSDTIKIIFIK